ncbi:TMV resistance protein N-like [Neltuma alba]|uniref:TMV resistance protein N-like n=1 Tax=Neltuma alba TaxID=207710 RepID=UPI0010A52480|nr:TMV resistance protein N-like [Prosopis alba]
MAASASSSSSSRTYHVYLSFGGADMRRGFISHLDKALKQRGIHVFLDEIEIQKGDDISEESLVQSIEASQIVLVIFSPDYACWRHCLDELVKIMECQRSQGQVVMPIFYQVHPSDVFHQKGKYGEAMEAHKQRFGSGSDQVLRWREALLRIANLPGWYHGYDRLLDSPLSIS